MIWLISLSRASLESFLGFLSSLACRARSAVGTTSPSTPRQQRLNVPAWAWLQTFLKRGRANAGVKILYEARVDRKYNAREADTKKPPAPRRDGGHVCNQQGVTRVTHQCGPTAARSPSKQTTVSGRQQQRLACGGPAGWLSGTEDFAPPATHRLHFRRWEVGQLSSQPQSLFALLSSHPNLHC